MTRNKKSNKSQSRRKKQTDAKSIEEEETKFLDNMIKSNKTKIPWYLSQNSMIVVLMFGIFLVHVKKNNVDITSIFNNDASINDSDPMSQCGLVMANSSLPDSGWGMFPLNIITEGAPVSFGDPIIQIPDIPSEQSKSISHLLHNYLWGGDVTGGVLEGKVVYSFLPGVGSLANGHPTQWNIAPSNGAKVGEAGVKRTSSPGAGAFTHYHDFSFFAYGKDIQAGEEIMVNYGSGWLSKVCPNLTNLKFCSDAACILCYLGFPDIFRSHCFIFCFRFHTIVSSRNVQLTSFARTGCALITFAPISHHCRMLVAGHGVHALYRKAQ